MRHLPFETLITAVSRIFQDLEDHYSFDLRKHATEPDTYQLVIVDDCYRHFRLALTVGQIIALIEENDEAVEQYIRDYLNKQGFFLPNDPLYFKITASGE